MNIRESLNAILASNGKFAESFYQRLAQDFPDVFQHFIGVNMKRQSHLLTTALYLIVGEIESPNESIKEYLHVLGTRHHDKHIDKSLYDHWQTALIASLVEFHGERWTSELESEWHSALQSAITEMFSGYDKRHHV